MPVDNFLIVCKCAIYVFIFEKTVLPLKTFLVYLRKIVVI